MLLPMLDSVKESVYWKLVHAVYRLLCETDRNAGIAKDVQLQLAHNRVHISFRRRVDERAIKHQTVAMTALRLRGSDHCVQFFGFVKEHNVRLSGMLDVGRVGLF